MSALDIVKSLIRTVADEARHRVEQSAPVSAARAVLDQLKEQRAILSEGALTAAAAHADGIRAATVTCRDGRIFVDATLRTGDDVHFSLAPGGVFFAPRGAKEIAFHVDPPEVVTSARAIVASLAACIARTIWPMLSRDGRDRFDGAIVDTDRGGTLRVDLRTVSAVRAAMSKGPQAMILDVLSLEAIRPESGQLVLKLKLPQLIG